MMEAASRLPLLPAPPPAPHLHHEADAALQRRVLGQPLHALKVHLHARAELILGRRVEFVAHGVEQLAEALNILGARQGVVLKGRGAGFRWTSESANKRGNGGSPAMQMLHGRVLGRTFGHNTPRLAAASHILPMASSPHVPLASYSPSPPPPQPQPACSP